MTRDLIETLKKDITFVQRLNPELHKVNISIHQAIGILSSAYGQKHGHSGARDRRRKTSRGGRVDNTLYGKDAVNHGSEGGFCFFSILS